jgi:hypothetical protein
MWRPILPLYFPFLRKLNRPSAVDTCLCEVCIPASENMLDDIFLFLLDSSVLKIGFPIQGMRVWRGCAESPAWGRGRVPSLLLGYLSVCLHVTVKSEDDTKGPHVTDPVPTANNVKEVRVLQPVGPEKWPEDWRMATNCKKETCQHLSASPNWYRMRHAVIFTAANVKL